MKFNVNDKVHLIEDVEDTAAGNRGVIMNIDKDLATGVETFEIYIKTLDRTLFLSLGQFGLYRAMTHISNSFSDV
jgi:hypothetical protein